MDFKDYLNQSKKEIDKELEEIFKTWKSKAADFNDKLKPFVEEAIKATTIGGKRLRGTLVKLGYELAGGQDKKAILKIAAAVEIFQTSVLIHDDIIDQSKTRRGRITTYRQLGGDHRGESLAITLGDAGFFLGYNILLKSNFNPQSRLEALKLFNDSLSYTCLGQLLDIEMPSSKVILEKDLFDIFYLKTAHYSFIGPLLLGASLGEGSDDLLSALEEFGKDLGIAFQITDDILGVFGKEQEMGKSSKSDIEEGKATLLLTYALNRANQEQKRVLNRYGSGKIGNQRLTDIRSVFVDTGAFDYAKITSSRYVKKAERLIPKITQDQKIGRLLGEMAEQLINRES